MSSNREVGNSLMPGVLARYGYFLLWGDEREDTSYYSSVSTIDIKILLPEVGIMWASRPLGVLFKPRRIYPGCLGTPPFFMYFTNCPRLGF